MSCERERDEEKMEKFQQKGMIHRRVFLKAGPKYDVILTERLHQSVWADHNTVA